MTIPTSMVCCGCRPAPIFASCGPDQVEAFLDHPDDLTDVLAEAVGERWQPYWAGIDPADPKRSGGPGRPWWATIILVTIGAYWLVA